MRLSTTTTIGDIVQNSGATCWILGVLYTCALVFGLRRLFLLRWSRARKTIDTPLLFVASVNCALLVRVLSFLNLTILSYEEIAMTAKTGPPLQSDQSFFASVLAIFFNVGDWVAISTYLLLSGCRASCTGNQRDVPSRYCHAHPVQSSCGWSLCSTRVDTFIRKARGDACGLEEGLPTYAWPCSLHAPHCPHHVSGCEYNHLAAATRASSLPLCRPVIHSTHSLCLNSSGRCSLYIGVFTTPDSNPSVVFQAIYGAVAFLNLIVPLGVVLTCEFRLGAFRLPKNLFYNPDSLVSSHSVDGVYSVVLGEGSALSFIARRV